MSRYIFLRIAWMAAYQGVKRNDIPVGAGSYITKNADGGEVYSFYPIGGKYYGPDLESFADANSLWLRKAEDVVELYVCDSRFAVVEKCKAGEQIALYSIELQPPTGS